MRRFGALTIFNTDRESQFTSLDSTGALKAAGVKTSTNDRGRRTDNVFNERLWRSLKYEWIYLREWDNGIDMKRGIDLWMTYCNHVRHLSALGDGTPDETYLGLTSEALAA